MPATGLEPVHPKAADFKSAASTISPGGPRAAQPAPARAGRQSVSAARRPNPHASRPAGTKAPPPANTAKRFLLLFCQKRRPCFPSLMYRAPALLTQAIQPPPAPPRARRRIPWRLLRWALIATVWVTLAAAAALLWFARDLPRPEDALDAVRRPSLVLQDRAGATIATYGDVVGEALRLPDLPPWLPEAAVSVEDRRFWTHGGLDWWGMGRALLVDLRAGHVVQGGSTITQQVAKTLFLTNARTFAPQGAGAAADALARTPLHQNRDPRDLAQPRLSRLRRLGRGRRRAHLFRRLRAATCSSGRPP